VTRRYHVTTFGCQMNAHDSERIKGMLEELGLGEASDPGAADVVVFNTCTIREKPDTKLAAYLGEAGARKRERPDMVIAVGGCYAEAQRERIFSLYPQVDVAFGPGTISHLGDWLGAGGFGIARGSWGTGDERAFAAALPMHRERRFQAWVQVSMGCNSVCSYCIVPAVRGREVSRRPGEVLAEIESLAVGGVREVTLLGQNVNSYGRDLGTGFAQLLRAVDAIDGIERVRFTSPHPKDFRRPVIEAMAECASVCEHAHLPLQSGSTRVLKAMRRTYSRERYLRLVDEMRAAIPDLALTTDLIVGFPGETEDDFRETLEVVEEVGYDGAFTFVYSPRAGTEAAAMPGQIPDEIKRERIEQLVELVQRVAAARNAERVGRHEEVLVEGTSRTDPTLLRGRTRRNTTVNFSGDADLGDLVEVYIESATSTTLRGLAQLAQTERGRNGRQPEVEHAVGEDRHHRSRERHAAPRERERQERLDRAGATER
jgi:tRNA-2-methylthio-N6-dimethylallyladenosine synthase